MIVKLWFYVLALIVFAPSISIADEQGQSYGLGSNSCAEFARSYAADPSVTDDLYFTWAQGFMSGLNLSAIAYKVPYRKIDGSNMLGQKIQIRSYCDAHPLVAYAVAVFDLYQSFPAALSSNQ
jgi:hypothetical protein